MLFFYNLLNRFHEWRTRHKPLMVVLGKVNPPNLKGEE